jgi:hypothetical protein
LLLVPGVALIQVLFDPRDLWVLPAVLTPLAFFLLGLTILAAFARDLDHEVHGTRHR